MRHPYDYEMAADQHAKDFYIDPQRKSDFIAGVKWAAQRFIRMLKPDIYEHFNGYPKDYINGLTLTDFRRMLEEFHRAGDSLG